MVRVQNPEDIHGIHQIFINDIGADRRIKHHVQEIGAVREVVPWIHHLVT